MNRKLILVTSGDPAGIGPEVIIKSFFEKRASSFFIIGRVEVFEKTAKFLNKNLPIKKMKDIGDFSQGKFNILEPEEKSNYAFGNSPSENSGKEAFLYLKKAVDLIKNEKIKFILTAPVSKKLVSKVFENFSGHTYFFADEFGIPHEDVSMIFYSRNLKISTVTQHLALREVSSALSIDKIISNVKTSITALKKTGMQNPRVAVCGLNPHCGEEGAFGDEEEKIIKPAVEKLKSEGVEISGPMNIDEAIIGTLKNKFDLIVSMYHDQGILPVKLLSHGRAANLTWGLPFYRISPLHGVAFDIAGKGIARCDSTVFALSLLEAMKDA